MANSSEKDISNKRAKHKQWCIGGERGPCNCAPITNFERIARDMGEEENAHTWNPTPEQVQELIRAARARHLAGGLAGHSPDCIPNLVDDTCRCGAIQLYMAFRDIPRND